MLLALTLLGCSTWIDQEPSCDQDVYYWSDDLLAHLLTGDGSGAFAYDPEDAPRTSIEGEYDPSDGDFEWVEKYDRGYYIARAEVEGFGTVYHNGNLDLLFTRTVTDMLGDVFATTYRVQRFECDMTVAMWAADGDVEDAFVTSGSYADEAVWEWEADYPGYDWRGGLRKNLSRSERIESDDGSFYSFTTSKPDGETESDFISPCGDYSCEGTEVRRFDGSLEQDYTYYDGGDAIATAEGRYEYDGSGTLTIDIPGQGSCVYAYDDEGDCTYECDDGDAGRC